MVAFLAGGIIGSIAAQLLEPSLPPSLGLSASLTVGLGEEVAKLVAVAWLLGRLEYSSMRHGLVFGGAAGTGFAAFESMGHALTLFEERGDMLVMGEALLAHAVLAPMVHGTWAAITAGILWRERRRGRVRLTVAVLLAHLGVTTLHGLWEWTVYFVPLAISVPGLSVNARPVNLSIPEIWLPLPAIVIEITGLLVLVRLFRDAMHRPSTSQDVLQTPR